MAVSGLPLLPHKLCLVTGAGLLVVVRLHVNLPRVPEAGQTQVQEPGPPRPDLLPLLTNQRGARGHVTSLHQPRLTWSWAKVGGSCSLLGAILGGAGGCCPGNRLPL